MPLSVRAASPAAPCAEHLGRGDSPDEVLMTGVRERLARPDDWMLRVRSVSSDMPEYSVATLDAINVCHEGISAVIKVDYQTRTGEVERVDIHRHVVPSTKSNAFLMGETVTKLRDLALTRALSVHDLTVHRLGERPAVRIVRTHCPPRQSVVYVEVEVDGVTHAGTPREREATRALVFAVKYRAIEPIL